MYRAFGLIISSDMHLPELMQAIGEPDVFIYQAKTPASLNGSALTGNGFQANEEQLLLQIVGVGRFLVRNGREVLVEPAESADAREVRLYLLGSVLCAVLNQRGIWPLHASSVVTAEGAVLFCGRSGSGKSTLLNFLMEHGHQALTDDLAAIIPDALGRPMVLPGIPRLKLWSDAANYFGHQPEELQMLRPGEEKYDVPSQSWFGALAAPIARVYVLDATAEGPLAITRLSAMEGLSALLNHTYRAAFTERLRQRVPHLQTAALVARQAPIYHITWPHTWAGFRNLAEHLGLEAALNASIGIHDN